LVGVCRIVDAPEFAPTIYERLVPYAQTLCVVSLNLSEMGPVSRALGVLASLMGDYSRAELHFADALATSERIAAPPHVARTSADYARMMLARGAAGDHERAQVLLTQARSIAERSGRVVCWPTSSAWLSSAPTRERLDGANVLRFLALLTGRDVELDALSLIEGSISVTLDGREVDEDVVPSLDGDEAVALFSVEPLDRTGRCHFVASLLAVPAPMSASMSGWYVQRSVALLRIDWDRNGTRAVVPRCLVRVASAATEADVLTVSQRTNRQAAARQITRFG